MKTNRHFLDNFAILTVKHFQGKHHVTEYMDITTGEIIDAKAAQALGMRIVRPDAQERREEKLDALRKEVRQFTDFLLKFRNRLGGFLESLDQLVKWYGKLEDKETFHVRRYFPRLVDAGILDFDLRLNPDFMRYVPDQDRRLVQSETGAAHRIYDEIRFCKKRKAEQLSREMNAERILVAA